MRFLVLVLAMAACLASGPAAAQSVRLQGYFIAFSDCAANKKKDSDNPGNVHLQAMHAYEMLARNSTPGTHYQVIVPNAPVTQQRWVPMRCGAYAPQDALVLAGGMEPKEPGSGGGGGGTSVSTLPPDGIELLLAASWEPAFCAGHRNKKECKTQTAGRFDATHFALHGLWPDNLDDKALFPCWCDRGPPRSCSSKDDLPDDKTIALSQAVRDKLVVVMPGVQSNLQLHEWPKHGSCYEDDKTNADKGATPDEYFTEAMALMAQLNASPMQALFAANIGKRLTRTEIDAAFNKAFGAGASKRLEVHCSGGNISELYINLKGDVTSKSHLSDLILAAPTTAVSSNGSSCAGGKVAAVAN